MRLFSLFIVSLQLALSILPGQTDNFRLSLKDHQSLKYKELIIRKQVINGAPWPEVMVFGKIDATPLESASVFHAYQDHKDFIPNLLRSDPVKYISPADIQVEFEMKISWPLKNSRYITGNRISKFGKGGYLIEWYHVTSTDTKDTKGDVFFIPYRGGTLLVYRSFIYPKNPAAGLFTKRMTEDIMNSVTAIIIRIEIIKHRHRSRMKRYILNLQKTFRGEYIYKNLPVIK